MGTQAIFMRAKVKDWVDIITNMVGVERQHPQAAYAVLQVPTIEVGFCAAHHQGNWGGF